jgi:hypothetical protein
LRGRRDSTSNNTVITLKLLNDTNRIAVYLQDAPKLKCFHSDNISPKLESADSERKKSENAGQILANILKV